MIIKNAKVYSDGCRFVEKDLIIRDGRIVFGAAPLEGEDVIDAGGAYALPGLVDIHFHGAVGHDFCDADAAGLQAIADFEASKGVLAICPATMTFSEEILNGIMDVAAAHRNERGADLVGINMEGPYISPRKVSTSLRMSRGLLRWAFMPALRERRTSSSKALAVRATMGKASVSGRWRARMAWAAS